MGQFREHGLVEFLEELITSNVDTVICEDYRNHGWMQQKKWGRNETSKVIGKIELMCDLRGVKLVLQPNTVKAVGYRWAGLEGPPSNHKISHQYDAYAHGVFWLQKNGIRPVGKALLDEQKDV